MCYCCLAAVASADTGITSNPPPAKVWDKLLGGEYDDRASAVKPTGDGGYIITGYSNASADGPTEVMLLKLDGNGKIAWDIYLNYGEYARGVDVIQAGDGGYAIAGYRLDNKTGTMDALLIKTDDEGNVEWDKLYGLEKYDDAYSVVQMAGGNYALLGTTRSFGNGSDFFLVVTDPKGNVVDSRHYGGKPDDEGNDVITTADGGLALLGTTSSYTDNSEMCLIKLDKDLRPEWTKTVEASRNEEGNSVIQTRDGGYLIAGNTRDTHGILDRCVVKLDDKGDMVWKNIYGGDTYDDATAVAQTSDGGYVVTGGTGYSSANDNAYVQKLDSNGEVEWEEYIDEGESNVLLDVTAANDGGCVLVGSILSKEDGKGGMDVFTVRYLAAPSATAAPTSVPENPGRSGGFCCGSALIMPLLICATIVMGGIVKRKLG